MQIFFQDKTPHEVISEIQEKLSNRKIGKIVFFELNGSNIHVKIKKAGTSTLEFEHSHAEGGHKWTLSKEKIALTHRVFKSEVIGKIGKVIGDIGGTLEKS